ncbi:MAG: AgmX/PglI C-terminal domain-containing protein, partial [Myxococcales bacterium]|nr:AgmX/PglI C-terminal domain-containing protein [Myxococcales bacterium]
PEPSSDAIDDLLGEGDLGLEGMGPGGGGVGVSTIGLGNLGTIGHGAGGQALGDAVMDGLDSDDASNASSGRSRRRSNSDPSRPASRQVRSGEPEVRGALSSAVIRRVIGRHEGEVRFCYDQELDAHPGLGGRLQTRFVISSAGAVQAAAIASSELANPRMESCLLSAIRRWRFPAPGGGGVVIVNYPFVFTGGVGAAALAVAGSAPDPHGSGSGSARLQLEPGQRLTLTLRWSTEGHRSRRCSDAARLSLRAKRSIWRERLGQAGAVQGWVRVYARAVQRCEAPSWRERRALLDAILVRAGSIERMLAVHDAMIRDDLRAHLRQAILRRVRTPAELRAVREALGAGAQTSELIEQVLERARTPEERLAVLRKLVLDYPRSLDLSLSLLEALERAGQGEEARRLADRLRADPMADSITRTAIGELLLRLGREAEARRAFSEIVEFSPADALARRRLGDLYRAHGWYEDAYRQYQTLATLQPDDLTVLLLMAQAAAGVGRVDEALRLEQRLAETAEPGMAAGLARTALLWSSVRFAELRSAARERDDAEQMQALYARMRRSGVLREAGALRVSLVFSHPDARLSLWAAAPGDPLSRPEDLAPDLGIEAFDVPEQEAGAYRFEVRRAGSGHLAALEAKLVIVWREGGEDEKIEILPLRFEGERAAFAWSLEADALSEREPASPGGGAR